MSNHKRLINIYPELKKIAGHIDAAFKLMDKLSEKIDTEGFDTTGIRLISGCVERDGHLYHDSVRLDNHGIQDGDYYCEQHVGYCEDDYHGILYFKTNVPGQFVAVPFEM